MAKVERLLSVGMSAMSIFLFLPTLSRGTGGVSIEN